jgi:hypothetical protein
MLTFSCQQHTGLTLFQDQGLLAPCTYFQRPNLAQYPGFPTDLLCNACAMSAFPLHHGHRSHRCRCPCGCGRGSGPVTGCRAASGIVGCATTARLAAQGKRPVQCCPDNAVAAVVRLPASMWLTQVRSRSSHLDHHDASSADSRQHGARFCQ